MPSKYKERAFFKTFIISDSAIQVLKKRKNSNLSLDSLFLVDEYSHFVFNYISDDILKLQTLLRKKGTIFLHQIVLLFEAEIVKLSKHVLEVDIVSFESSRSQAMVVILRGLGWIYSFSPAIKELFTKTKFFDCFHEKLSNFYKKIMAHLDTKNFVVSPLQYKMHSPPSKPKRKKSQVRTIVLLKLQNTVFWITIFNPYTYSVHNFNYNINYGWLMQIICRSSTFTIFVFYFWFLLNEI